MNERNMVKMIYIHICGFSVEHAEHVTRGMWWQDAADEIEFFKTAT